jgi:nucleotide-binding universal stress UspA family protein
MTHVLVATASVHTTAAACDYLAGRLGASDTVTLLTVEGSDMAGRDAGDAANVARTRLPEPTVESLTRTGDPAKIIRAVAADANADELLIGPTRGDPERAGEPPGSTARALVADPPAPVVVVPV